jgi:DNA-binding transcriptional LysR family regulator
MWDTVELREIRVFLALAEELHFGRAAERLGLTQSRVSQSLRRLEHKLGGRLLDRTSRRVSLTPLGERFRVDAGDAYGRLADVLRHSSSVTGRLAGTLRLGTFEPCSAGPHLLSIVEAFEERNRECEVLVTEISHGADPLGVLRRGDVDVLAIRLPLDDSSLVVGPRLTREPRLLAVATHHPLAAREQVSLEDVADYEVTECAGVPKPIMEAYVPTHAPSGRPIRRIPRSPVKPFELAALVARGKVVHPTVASFATHFGQPGIGYVPIAGMAPLESALVWPRGRVDRRRGEFVGVARAILRDRADPAPSLTG